MDELNGLDHHGQERITGRRLLEFLKTMPANVLDQPIYVCDDKDGNPWPLAFTMVRPINEEDDEWISGSSDDVMDALIFFPYGTWA